MKKIIITLTLSLIANFSIAQVGVGTTTPAATADITALNPSGAATNVDGLLIPRVDRRRARNMTPVTNSTLIYVDNLNNSAAGQAINIDAVGFYYFDGTLLTWQKLTSANNNWTLTGNTGTTAGTNYVGTTDATDLRFKTNNTNRLNISNTNGQIQSYYAGTQSAPSFSWNTDTNTGMFQGGADVLGFTTNSLERAKINTTEMVVNDNSNNFDFRIEGDNTQYALFSDASNDAIMFGSVGNLFDDGTSFSAVSSGYTNTINYVADFDAGTSRGTTMGLGSIEYLVDGEAELFISDNFSPVADLTFDLGYENSWRDVYAQGFWTISDIRAKENIKPLTYGLNEIMKLNTISYTLKADKHKRPTIGVIAQEVNELIKEATITETYKKKEDGTFEKVKLGEINVSYDALVPVLIKAVQEQQEIIKSLEARIEKLEKK